MPQLDPTTFVPQLFWLAVTFIVLYLLMRLVALPQVGAVIAARRQRLDDDLARAATIRSEAEAVLAAYEASLAAARAQAHDAIRATLEQAAAEAAARQRQLGEALAEQTVAAERQIAAAKQRAFSEIRGIAVDVARSVAQKLTGSEADEVAVSAAVERTLAERSAP
ncbi:MAG TPA: F0F1 ATP synthase subunit B' [Stellaceae bacterium]|nr:F0F1 ATP synthase subunit B' [Stellaceae bacterium]